MKIFKTLVATVFSFSMVMGQITITHQDIRIPLTPDTAKGQEAIGAGLPVPGTGANQQWNYSALLPAAQVDFVLDSADGNPNFLSATAKLKRQDFIGPQPLNGFYDYYQHNSSGFYFMGTEIDSGTYNISGLTGGPGDELTVLSSHVNYGQTVLRYKLPLSMGTSWTNTYEANIDFTVIVQFLSLLDDTAQLKRFITEDYEVVGWGQVDLPLNHGLHDGLLLKIQRKQIDSLFLNGSPADPLLLIGVGLSQGAVTKTSEYELLVPGLNRSAITFIMDTAFAYVNWAHMSTLAPSGVGLAEHELQQANTFPNPTSGEVVFSCNKPTTGDWLITVADLTGKKMIQQKLNSVGVVETPLMLPDASGVYILSVSNEEGALLYTEKVVKQ